MKNQLYATKKEIFEIYLQSLVNVEDCIRIDNVDFKKLEVIGNIHDNPELLK